MHARINYVELRDCFGKTNTSVICFVAKMVGHVMFISLTWCNVTDGAGAWVGGIVSASDMMLVSSAKVVASLISRSPSSMTYQHNSLQNLYTHFC